MFEEFSVAEFVLGLSKNQDIGHKLGRLGYLLLFSLLSSRFNLISSLCLGNGAKIVNGNVKNNKNKNIFTSPEISDTCSNRQLQYSSTDNAGVVSDWCSL